MPAFGDRLDPQDVEDVAAYVYDQATNAKWDQKPQIACIRIRACCIVTKQHFKFMVIVDNLYSADAVIRLSAQNLFVLANLW